MTIHAPTPEIARTIDAGSSVVDKRVRLESLGGQVGASMVARRDSITANADLAGNPDGRRSIAVEHIDASVVDRPSDANRAVARPDKTRRRPYRGLGGPVEVPELTDTLE